MRAGLPPPWMRCSPMGGGGQGMETETEAWLDMEVSSSSSGGCSSPGHMVGHGSMFTAMLTAGKMKPLFVVQSCLCCLFITNK